MINFDVYINFSLDAIINTGSNSAAALILPKDLRIIDIVIILREVLISSMTSPETTVFDFSSLRLAAFIINHHTSRPLKETRLSKEWVLDGDPSSLRTFGGDTSPIRRGFQAIIRHA